MRTDFGVLLTSPSGHLSFTYLVRMFINFVLALLFFQGGFGLVWCLAWFALVHDSPQSHPRISIEERDYIVSAIEEEHCLPKNVR